MAKKPKPKKPKAHGKAKWVRIKAKASKYKPSQMFEHMSKKLEEMAKCIRDVGIDAEARIHMNKDRSIDGWVRIRTIPKKYSVRTMMFKIGEGDCLKPINQEVWVHGSALWSGDQRDDIGTPLERFKGMGKMRTHWTRSTGNRPVNNWITLTGSIGGMQRRWKYRPVQVMSEYHWNPRGLKASVTRPRKRLKRER